MSRAYMDTVVEKDLNNLDDNTEFRRIVFFAFCDANFAYQRSGRFVKLCIA